MSNISRRLELQPSIEELEDNRDCRVMDKMGRKDRNEEQEQVLQ